MSEVILADQQEPILPSNTVTPMTMINIAVEKNASVEQLTQLMELQERYEANEARKAFNAAMTAFKANPPEIFKKKAVSFNQTSYKHATLDHVANQISAAMAVHGLSFRWDVDQSDKITVCCVIMHELGHSERVSLTAPADDSGKKNSIQAIGSTVTYLQRYTLLAATGLAAQDDDDGRSSRVVNTISEDQVANLESLLTEVKADRAKYLVYFKVEKLEDIPADWYSRAVEVLEGKRK